MKRSSFRFLSKVTKFGPQITRALLEPRKAKVSAFVSGNYQFVYTSCSEIADPDVLADLNDVLFAHALFPSSDPEWSLLYSLVTYQPPDLACPICLFPPVAPRISTCGHIFCLDCAMQHFQHGFDVCPVCFMPLSPDTLLRADIRTYNEDNTTELTKVYRNRNCCCIFPVGFKGQELPTASDTNCRFNHFTIADTEYSQQLLAKEIAGIEKAIVELQQFREEEKISFLKAVLESVKNEKVIGQTDAVFHLQEPTQNQEFFYQSSDGRLVFLDPLSNEMLRSQFGSIRNAPETITVPMIAFSQDRVDHYFRERFRNYRHLSTGAAVTFLLADLSSYVKQEILDDYAPYISERVESDEPPVDDVPKINMDISEFPSLVPEQEEHSEEEYHPPQKSSPWDSFSSSKKSKADIERDYPSLSSVSAPPPKKTGDQRRNKWDSLMKKPSAQTTQSANDDDWPSLSG